MSFLVWYENCHWWYAVYTYHSKCVFNSIISQSVWSIHRVDHHHLIWRIILDRPNQSVCTTLKFVKCCWLNVSQHLMKLQKVSNQKYMHALTSLHANILISLNMKAFSNSCLVVIYLPVLRDRVHRSMYFTVKIT